MSSVLDSIRIVLVNTSHPGNIGSVARAMKTMGLSQLYLVEPKHFPHANALELASSAEDILASARVVDTLEAAIADCHLVLATSARSREIPLDYRDPRQAGELSVSAAKQHQVALVFGPERTGLSNEALLRCHYHVIIPSNPDYSSLNLAAAVQVLCYECRVAALSAFESNQHQPLQDELASSDDIERLHQHLEQVMTKIGFYDPNNPKRLLQRLRRLIGRIHLEKMEVSILRGVLKHIDRSIAFHTPKS